MVISLPLLLVAQAAARFGGSTPPTPTEGTLNTSVGGRAREKEQPRPFDTGMIDKWDHLC